LSLKGRLSSQEDSSSSAEEVLLLSALLWTLQIYRELNGKFGKLAFIPVLKSKPTGADYDIQREHFINTRIKHMLKSNTPLYYKSGKYKDLPTKQHLILIMNSYSPDPRGIKKRIKLLDQN